MSPPDDEFSQSPASAEVKYIAAELLPTFYDELKQIAQRARTRSGRNYTLQTTALVHEAYIRLRQAGGFTDETDFLRAAALVMRHVALSSAESFGSRCFDPEAPGQDESIQTKV